MIRYISLLLFVIFDIINATNSSFSGQFEPDRDMMFSTDNRTKSSILTVRQTDLELFEEVATNSKLARVLSIDGGGVRGVAPASWCASLERSTEKSIADIFNLLAGTSTGAIIASGLAMEDPNSPGHSLYKADDIVGFYNTESKKIFSRRTFLGYLFLSKYKTKPAYSVFDKLYGNVKLSQIRPDCDLLVPYYNLTNNRPCFFKNHKAKNPALERTEDFYLRDVIAATTAAPTYFKDFKLYTAYNKNHFDLFKNTYVSVIDGCVAVNDPTECALVQAESMYPRADSFLLVSMGTGLCISEVNPRGLLSWARHISNILMRNSSDMLAHMFKKFGIYSNSAFFFSRLQFNISESHLSMDDISPTNLSYLQHQALSSPAMEKLQHLGRVLRTTDKPKREELSANNRDIKSMFIEI